jgi:1-acyl-sn-glycerol-3-phosphate acyltransferase
VKVALRSLAFHAALVALTVGLGVFCLPVLLYPRRHVVALGRWWSRALVALLARIVGLRHAVRAPAGAPLPGPAIYAFKHQSAWETLVMPLLLSDPAIVLKRNLVLIPIFGWLLFRHGMIPIDRRGRARALRRMLLAARQAVAAGRPIVIFPEGTRTRPGERRPYHRGVVALYRALGLPVVPVALDSGRFWAKQSFLRRPGTITVAFLPPIPPGLESDEFLRTLEDRIETEAARLAAGEGAARPSAAVEPAR